MAQVSNHRRPRQDDPELRVSLKCTVRPCRERAGIRCGCTLNQASLWLWATRAQHELLESYPLSLRLFDIVQPSAEALGENGIKESCGFHGHL